MKSRIAPLGRVIFRKSDLDGHFLAAVDLRRLEIFDQCDRLAETLLEFRKARFRIAEYIETVMEHLDVVAAC
jgi:hypothetical protein